MTDWIRNPIEWSADQVRLAAGGIGAAGRALAHIPETMHSPAPTVRRIRAVDVLDALVLGAEDFAACRTDVIFLCAFYPLSGFVLARIAFGSGMIQLLFPLIAGFALLGPIAAVGLMEMSRKLERGEPVTAATALAVVRAPGFVGIALLGLTLMAIFMLWLGAAALIYRLTFGAAPPASLATFAHSVFTTPQGWTMMAVGVCVGFFFALLVLVISVASFALLLDRDAGLDTAVATSIRVSLANPGPIALWGAIVAFGLAIGSLPALLGLIVVFPILGHASWRLYRKVVAAS